MDSLEEFILHLNTVHPTLKFTSVISSTEIAFLDLTIYITDDKLCTRLYTKGTDRHMYLNFHSEHPLNLKRSIPYSQFLRLKRIHSESYYLIQSQIHLNWYFIWRKYPHDVVLEAWQKTNKVNRESLLDGTTGKKKLKHLSCLSLHITVLTPTSGRSYPNIGPFWEGLVPPEN